MRIEDATASEPDKHIWRQLKWSEGLDHCCISQTMRQSSMQAEMLKAVSVLQVIYRKV